MMEMGKEIHRLRNSRGITQEALAEALNVTAQTVSKWECGRVTDVPAGKIKAMAQLFDVPPSYLIDDETASVPRPTVEGGIPDEDVKFALFGGDMEITDEMYEEVKQFAAFVKARNKK